MLVSLLVAIGAVTVGFVVSKFLYKKDTEVEDRRRAAIKISSSMKEKGLVTTAAFLEDYAVGDYSGMAKKLKDLSVVMSNPAAVEAEFAVVFAKLLQGKLNSPEGLAEIAKAVAEKQGPPVVA